MKFQLPARTETSFLDDSTQYFAFRLISPKVFPKIVRKV